MIDVDDRPVEKGDTVTLDYAGTVDGVAFDGGTARTRIWLSVRDLYSGL